MQIRTDTGRISFSESGTFWAGIYVQSGGYAFPENVWDDIVFGVLGEWGWNCVQLIEHEQNRESFRFFDGPYHITCARMGDELSVECVNDGSNSVVDRAFTSSAKEFFASYVAAFDELYEAYLSSNGGEVDLTERRCIDACIGARAKITDYLQNT